MEKPSPATPGKVAAADHPPLTSHTISYGTENTDGMPPVDQTIRVKMPGTGMVVFSRYKLQRILGRGGMGIVWLADDLKLERPVALKFLPSLIGLDPAAVKELKTETRRGLELSHPNIVRIYDFVDDEDAAAISMEFVDGKTLSELRSTTEHGIFPVEEVAKWLPGVCDALDYAHFQRKVVHRDLKPANIMITTKDEVAKVADFGIARSLSDTMSRLSAAHIGTSGTLPYMSPQQAMGERPLPTDDVYSLGATIYELLAGKPPFYRGDLPTQINSKVPPPMMERRRELDIGVNDPIPKEWEEAIAACLHKDPLMRPSCAGMLMEMLGLKPGTGTSRTLMLTGTMRPPISSKAKAAKGSKAGVWTAAAALVVCGGAAAWYFANKDRPQDRALASATAPVAVPTPASESKSAPALPKEKAPSPAKEAAPEVTEAAPAPAPKAGEDAPTPAAATVPAVAAATTGSVSPAMPSVASTPAPAPLPGSTPLVTTGPERSPPSEAATFIPGTPPAIAAMPPPATPAPGSGAIVQAPPSAPVETVSPPMSLTPDGPPQIAAPATTVAAATTLPPGIIAQPIPVAPASQPVVSDPPAGYWTLDELYPSPPFATYSAPGRKYLLYRTQATLKERGLYTSSVDGKEGKSTHNAIQLFQAKSGLRPNGLLDAPTLSALQLSAEPDAYDWSGPTSIPSAPGSVRRSVGGSRYNRPQERDDPNFLERTSDRLRNIFGR